MTTSRGEPISYGYVKISESLAKMMAGVWLDRSLPKSQWKIVSPILKSKVVPEVAKPVVGIIEKLGLERASILDVGCSSGFYSDFFKWSNFKIRYQGCDISPYFISLAREKYPHLKFKVTPILNLPYVNDSFDVVLASGVLQAELDYSKAILELTRVTSKYILLHRVPIFSTKSKSRLAYYKKVGYGIEMMETIFDLLTLKRIFKKLKS